LGGVYVAGRMEVAGSNDAVLVSRIRAGERPAEDELVQRFSRGVSIIIGQSVADPAAAADVYQETFRLALMKVRAGEVRDPERLAGFICGIARSLVIEHFRGTARSKARHKGEPDRQLASSEPSQLDQLLREERATLARQVLSELPSDRDRKILCRFYIEDDDKDDICADLGISALHFNQVISRARQRYKKIYESMGEGRKT
jgi:RNA polymerase sigma-70 factor, ECF subfamily